MPVQGSFTPAPMSMPTGYQAMRAPMRSKRTLLADVRKADMGMLGPSEGDQQRDIARQMADTDAATNAQLAELGRQNLAAAGTGVSGQLAAQQQGIAAKAVDQQAKTSGAVRAQARDIAAQQRADLTARLERQQDRARQNAVDTTQAINEFWKNANETAKTVMGAGMGG